MRPASARRGPSSAYRAFEVDLQQLLGLDGELHGQLVHYLLGVAVDDEPHDLLGGNAALLAVEDLLLVDLGGGGLVLGGGVGASNLYVGKGVGAAAVAEQQGVALGVVAGAAGGGGHAHQAAVGVLALAGRYALADDGGAGVAPQVYHLGAGVGLLVVARQGHGVELAHGAVALQYARGVLPGDGGACLDLRPGELGGVAAAEAALGDEVVDAAAPLLVAGVPVLHGGVLDFGAVFDHDLDDGGVELVLVAHGCGASFEVGHVGVVVGHDEGALELAGAGGVDAEVGAELHGAAHAAGNVDEGAVGEDGRVEGRPVVVAVADYRAEVLAHQVGVVLHGLGDGAEDDAELGELLAVGGLDADGVHDGVYGHSGQLFLFLERDAELIERVEQLGVHLVEALLQFLGLGGGIVADGLQVDGGDVEVSPVRRGHRQPMAVGAQAELEQPFRLVLEAGDGADGLFVESGGHDLGVDVGHETVLVVVLLGLAEQVLGVLLRVFWLCHGCILLTPAGACRFSGWGEV